MKFRVNLANLWFTGLIESGRIICFLYGLDMTMKRYMISSMQGYTGRVSLNKPRI